MKSQLTIPGPTGEVSDGYHTFDDLYQHRNMLFLTLLHLVPGRGWVARRHDDGRMYDNMFIAGLLTAAGPVTYHLPDDMWDLALCTGVKVLPNAPPWDGHTADDVIARLARTLLENLPMVHLRNTTDTDSGKKGIAKSGIA